MLAVPFVFGAYPVRKSDPLQSVNHEYLAYLRAGLEEAGLYRHQSYPEPAEASFSPEIRDEPPPAPCETFTLGGGLRVSLRCGSGAIQTLGYADTTHPEWWGDNFSFVPPLWNAYPPRAHRDQPGAHHLGDLTLRLQPASSKNLSDTAFYSSARGGAAAGATPLQRGDALYPKTPLKVLAAADLTPTLLAPGQLDTRYPLGGLSVVRSFEDPADAAGGVVMRFTLALADDAAEAVRLAGLGFSMVSDNTYGGLNTTQVAAALSFMDPHIGADQGWHTWARADGSKTLVAVPYGHCPFEAYRPVFEDAGWTQMGTFEWSAHSAGTLTLPLTLHLTLSLSLSLTLTLTLTRLGGGVGRAAAGAARFFPGTLRAVAESEEPLALVARRRDGLRA